MFKQFISLNTKLWWRSLRGAELGAILFYSLFLLLVLGQFIAVAITLVFATEVEAVREIYPWYTSEVHLMFNLVFVNLFWFTQLFFTKISRLRLHDNRKLLAYGLPVARLSTYLNIAGFFHPVNMLFTLVWAYYLGLMTQTLLQFITVLLLLVVNYGVINSIKWRFKLFASENLKWVNGALAVIIVSMVIIGSTFDLQPYLSSPQLLAPTVIEWLKFSPGVIFYGIAGGGLGTTVYVGLCVAFAAMLFLLHYDLYLKTREALLASPGNGSAASDKSPVENFIKWLGSQGGKYFFSVWNHPYTKTQFLLTYVLVIPYIVFLADGSTAGNYMVAVFLTLIPVVFLMVMLTNMFGFENREMLLILQAPVSRYSLIRDRFVTALKVSCIALLTSLIAIPFFFSDPYEMLKIFTGLVLISLLFLHFAIGSFISNYKKIEEVSLMSVSNPVVPASVTFSTMLMVLIAGIFTFLLFDQNPWIHILGMVLIILLLAAWLVKKFRQIEQQFNKKVIPRLWNEL
jgi:hypothetical protein